MVTTVVLVMSIVFVLSIMWARAIDSMHEKHPDYKGEDLFEDDKEG